MILDHELDDPGDERHPDQYRVPMPHHPGLWLIRHDKTDQLADLIMLDIANTIADLIGAGSERDSVLEDDALRSAIIEQLMGWSNHPVNMAHYDDDRPPGTDSSPDR